MGFRLFKDITVAAAHQTTALGNSGAGKKKKKKPKMISVAYNGGGRKQGDMSIGLDKDFTINMPITKIDEELRTVWGWASVTHEAGQIVTDTQGDQIEIGDLVKAAHGFMQDSRVGGDMHSVLGIGSVVESLVFTPEVQEALGVDLGKAGWFIGLHVEDDAVWKRVKAGELSAFSFGGRGVREAIAA